MDLAPVVLEGRWLRLEPLDERHAEDLHGHQRDTVDCSIVDDEWPAVEARLAARSAEGGAAPP